MSSDPIIGKKLGDYLIVDILGQGGMARVYRGLDKKLNRYAAVKVIDASSIREDEAEYKKRFQGEARAVARLNHPNIVGIYQFDQVDTLYYMAMSFIEGRDLRSIIKTHDRNGSRMSGTEVRNIIRDIGAALDYAHSEGVIHRDIKPSNIMVTSSGKAILTDFGLALSVPEGTIGNTFGSAHYVAPEQAVNSAQAVAQSDIYSLGIVLFEMLTNRVPFDDPSAMAVAMKHLTDPPPAPSKINPTLSPQIDRVVIQALDKDPKKRYGSCAEMLKALEKALGLYDEGNSTTKMPMVTLPVTPPPAAPKMEQKVDENKETTEVTGIKAPAGFETNLFPANVTTDGPTVTDSKASAATRAAVLAAQANRAKQKRSRQIRQIVLPVIVIGMAFVAGLALLSNNSNKVINDLATKTGALASATTNSATSEAAASTSEPSQTEAAIFTANTEVATDKSPTTEPTAVPNSDIPTVTPLKLAETNTDTPAPTATVTDTASTGTTVAAPTLVTVGDQTQPVILRYDDQVLTLFNRGKTNVNVTNLTFILNTTSSNPPQFTSQEWAASSTRSFAALQPGECLQVIRNDRFLSASTTKPDYCEFVQAWRQISIRRVFWVSTDANATFEVKRGSGVLATCMISAGECTFDPK
ncbi:MAG: protein kinase [Anaerolineaceae bacterium]|nr:protein kinase [Anaerolineaceae bacterium]